MFEPPRVWFKRNQVELVGIVWGKKFIIVKDGDFVKYIPFSKHIIIDRPVGTNDLNGVPVYERDIIVYRKEKYVVVYSNNVGKFYGIDDRNRTLEAHGFRYAEVIGNVIKDPLQLFTEKKQSRLLAAKKVKKEDLIWPEIYI